MTVTKEFVQSVRQRLSENPNVPTAALAVELNAPESYIIMALPVHMRLKAKPENFAAIWEILTTWEKAKVALAQEAEDFLPVMPDKRFFQQEVGHIWFVSSPPGERESHSVRFFDKHGTHMISVHLGQDDDADIPQKDKSSYDSMRERFGVVPVPRRHCQGCGNCTCGSKKNLAGDKKILAA